MTTGELSLQLSENGIFERSTALAYLNANGSVNLQANRMFSTYTRSVQARCLIATEGASPRFISWLSSFWRLFFFFK